MLLHAGDVLWYNGLDVPDGVGVWLQDYSYNGLAHSIATLIPSHTVHTHRESDSLRWQ